MAWAMLYPERKQGKRTDIKAGPTSLGSKEVGFSAARLSQARTVLHDGGAELARAWVIGAGVSHVAHPFSPRAGGILPSSASSSTLTQRASRVLLFVVSTCSTRRCCVHSLACFKGQYLPS